MAVSVDMNMLGLNSKLSKSANSLDSALAARYGKSIPFGNDIASADSLYVPANTNEGSGFDEWLANDPHFGPLSDEASTASSSPVSSLDDSPVLGFEGISAGSLDSLNEPSLFDMSMVFPNNNLNTISVDYLNIPISPEMNTTTPSSSPNASPVKTTNTLTSAAVQQAAVALNIPWSLDLEKAVMDYSFIPESRASSIIPKVEAIEPTLSSPEITANVLPTNVTETKSATSASVMTSPIAPVVVPRLKGKNKRSAPLTPEEEMEEIIAKRAKNTDAARRSRLKKLLRLEGLENKVAELESVNTQLTMKVAVLESEKNGHIVKEAEQSARIAQLEAKLAEAHLALTNRA